MKEGFEERKQNCEKTWNDLPIGEYFPIEYEELDRGIITGDNRQNIITVRIWTQIKETEIMSTIEGHPQMLGEALDHILCRTLQKEAHKILFPDQAQRLEKYDEQFMTQIGKRSWKIKQWWKRLLFSFRVKLPQNLY